MDNLDVLMVNVEELKPLVAEVCKQLKSGGIKIVGVTEGDMNVDPCIELENNFDIQIALDGMFCLTEYDETDGTVAYLVETTDFDEVLDYIVSHNI